MQFPSQASLILHPPGKCRGAVVSQSSPNPRRDWSALEERIHALSRTQAKRRAPIDVGTPSFWDDVMLLTADLDARIRVSAEVEGYSSMKTQELVRRRHRLRTSLADLARDRLCAMLANAAAREMRSPPSTADTTARSQDVPALDWNRHDRAERIAHDALVEVIRSFKKSIKWSEILDVAIPSLRPSGIKPLDDFVGGTGKLTGMEPPAEAAEEGISETWEDPELNLDESSLDPFPELMDLSGPIAELSVRDAEDGFIPPQLAIETTPPTSSSSSDENTPDQPNGTRRIRILIDLPEPILDDNGGEIELKKGDTRVCSFTIATTLIQAGFAEAADL